MKCFLSKSLSYTNFIYEYLEETIRNEKLVLVGKKITKSDRDYRYILSRKDYVDLEINSAVHIDLLLKMMNEYESENFELSWKRFENIVSAVNMKLGHLDEFAHIIDDIRNQNSNYDTIDSLRCKHHIINTYLKDYLPQPKIENFKIISVNEVEYELNEQGYGKDYYFQYLLGSSIDFYFKLLNKEYYMTVNIAHLDHGAESWNIFIQSTKHQRGLSPNSLSNREYEIMKHILNTVEFQELKKSFKRKKDSLSDSKIISANNITPIKRSNSCYTMKVVFSGYEEEWHYVYDTEKINSPITMDEFICFWEPFKMYPGWYIDLVNETSKIINDIKIKLVK